MATADQIEVAVARYERVDMLLDLLLPSSSCFSPTLEACPTVATEWHYGVFCRRRRGVETRLQHKSPSKVAWYTKDK